MHLPRFQKMIELGPWVVGLPKSYPYYDVEIGAQVCTRNLVGHHTDQQLPQPLQHSLPVPYHTDVRVSCNEVAYEEEGRLPKVRRLNCKANAGQAGDCHHTVVVCWEAYQLMLAQLTLDRWVGPATTRLELEGMA